MSIFKILIVGFLLTSTCLLGQTKVDSLHAPSGLDNETLKRANDPMARIKALNLQNYVVSSIYGTDATQNQLLLRYSQPVGNILIRATLPFITNGQPNNPATFGVGDFNMFAIYTLPSTSGNKFGIGSLLVAPTASSIATGSGKWQTGLSALAFFAKNHMMQVGSLVQWQTSFAGDKNRTDVNLLTSQIFMIMQVGGGYYLRSTGVWSFNLQNQGNYNVPLGLGLGKVMKVGKVVFNIFAEPQFTVIAEGYGQPKFQTFVGFNTQF